LSVRIARNRGDRATESETKSSAYQGKLAHINGFHYFLPCSSVRRIDYVQIQFI
jgi:hypothetical protein